ncbi:MAG: hypothetical protein LBU73_07135 [Helicobacteraceae bacterium]|nr:hypothetical protein [Helicobacteraceae bacterium]
MSGTTLVFAPLALFAALMLVAGILPRRKTQEANLAAK